MTDTEALLLANEIIDLLPDDLRFNATEHELTSVAMNVKKGRYKTLMYYYGHPFLLTLIDYFEGQENFEQCAAIKKSLEDHNRILDDYLPTR